MAWKTRPLFSAHNHPFSRPVRVLLLVLLLVLLVFMLLGFADQDSERLLYHKLQWKSSIVSLPVAKSGRQRPQLPVLADSNPNFAAHSYMDCRPDPGHLSDIQNRYQLGQRFEYMKRYVRFTRTSGLQRKSMTQVDQSFLSGKTHLDTVTVPEKLSDESECPTPIELPVPNSGFPQTVDASDFMFAVSTTYQRIMSSDTGPLEEWRFWLTDGNNRSNGGKLLLVVIDATASQLQELANTLGDIGIDVDVYAGDSSLPMAVRYFKLIPTLYMHSDVGRKKWLVACDDDTFFPNMHALVERFADYNHSREMYIGTLSEDFSATDLHGPEAFGGAGVFFSVPLAKRITELHGRCLSQRDSKPQPTDQGDALVRDCIYDNTETRLTTLPDLWQLDLRGDVSGFYESGIFPLSLHHFHSWHRAQPTQLTRVAYRCGEACSMLRFRTADNFIISGHSVARYPKGIDFNTDQVEGTMPLSGPGRLDYRLGPQRPTLSRTGRKIAWQLEETHDEVDGSIRQIYIRKSDDDRWKYPNGQKMSNVDGVIELVWISSSSS